MTNTKKSSLGGFIYMNNILDTLPSSSKEYTKKGILYVVAGSVSTPTLAGICKFSTNSPFEPIKHII